MCKILCLTNRQGVKFEVGCNRISDSAVFCCINFSYFFKNHLAECEKSITFVPAKNRASERRTQTCLKLCRVQPILRETKKNERDVAQPGRVRVWGACGRKFKSCHPDS